MVRLCGTERLRVELLCMESTSTICRRSSRNCHLRRSVIGGAISKRRGICIRINRRMRKLDQAFGSYAGREFCVTTLWRLHYFVPTPPRITVTEAGDNSYSVSFPAFSFVRAIGPSGSAHPLVSAVMVRSAACSACAIERVAAGCQ
jgi:hypothetical protein